MDRGQLHLAAISVGLPLDFMDRISSVQQPTESAALGARFLARASDIQRLPTASDGSVTPAAALPESFVLNPSGQAWILIAFPDGTEGDALRMFEADTGDQQAGVAGVHRIALAGPAYEGVAVLARCLFGPKPVLDSNGALSFEPVFWPERGAGVDPRCWSVGCFRNRDQLMPIFLFRIGLALHSDLQGEVNRLKRKNDDLHSQLNSRSAPFQKQLRARQTSERRARKKKRGLSGRAYTGGDRWYPAT